MNPEAARKIGWAPSRIARSEPAIAVGLSGPARIKRNSTPSSVMQATVPFTLGFDDVTAQSVQGCPATAVNCCFLKPISEESKPPGVGPDGIGLRFILPAFRHLHDQAFGSPVENPGGERVLRFRETKEVVSYLVAALSECRLQFLCGVAHVVARQAIYDRHIAGGQQYPGGPAPSPWPRMRL